jgi:hypothetical protein
VVRLCASPLFASMRICLLRWCGGEDAAGDGSGLFPHVGAVGVGPCVPEFLCGVVKDAGELGGGCGLMTRAAEKF